MTRTLFICFLLLPGLMVFSQDHDFKTILESGKAEFNVQAKKDTSDYSKCYKIFAEAVKLEPDDAEARYFWGYTIDRINSNDGGRMTLSGKSLTIQASEQFEEKTAPASKLARVKNLAAYSIDGLSPSQIANSEGAIILLMDSGGPIMQPAMMNTCAAMWKPRGN